MTQLRGTKDPRFLAFVETHKNDRPRARYARLAGVSLGTWYYYLHEVGADIKDLKATRQEWERRVTELYPTMWAKHIAREIGASYSQVRRIIQKLHLTRTAEQQAVLDRRVKAMQSDNLRKAHTEDCVRRAVETLRKTRRAEARREAYGLTRKTRLHVNPVPHRVIKVTSAMVCKYGYIATTNPYILWYDDNTTRNVKGGGRHHRMMGEEYYTQKYHIKFKQAE